MAKKRKMKMEFRYYQMQDGIPILALLGEKWVQNYGRDVDLPSLSITTWRSVSATVAKESWC